MSLVVHHLNNSRSQRVLWALEELGLPYEIKHYQRDAVTNLAPPELKAVHPLGKSPLLEDNGTVIEESGAIIQYLLDKKGKVTGTVEDYNNKVRVDVAKSIGPEAAGLPAAEPAPAPSGN